MKFVALCRKVEKYWKSSPASGRLQPLTADTSTPRISTPLVNIDSLRSQSFWEYLVTGKFYGKHLVYPFEYF